MMKQKSSLTLAERLNIGEEVRELKLGCTFDSKNTSTAFHTIKYDFKPASVDTSKIATVDIGSNNQVTVTVPNLVNSGVPHTVYKGNHRKCTKECLIIFDKKTGEFTLEKLNHNIQVKKTRSEMPTKSVNAIAPSTTNLPQNSKIENSTKRVSTKTKVSTGSRRNNIIDFKPRNLPMQGSPSTVSHRSPQSAPAWNANNTQATLPSIPMIVDDDDSIFNIGNNSAASNGVRSGLANVSSSSSASSHNNSTHMKQQKQIKQSNNKNNQKRNNNRDIQKQEQKQAQIQRNQINEQNQRQEQTSLQTQMEQVHQWQQQLQQQQQLRQKSPTYSTEFMHEKQQSKQNLSKQNHMQQQRLNSQTSNDDDLEDAAAALEQQIGELSSSSSSSESDSSDSDSSSESGDSAHDELAPTIKQHQMNQLPNLGMGPGTLSPEQQLQHAQIQFQTSKNIGYASNGSFPDDLLQNDLQLSSNSSDEDDN